jgi:hypothetical protein
MGGEASSTGGETPPTGGEAPPMGLQSEKSVNSSGDPRAWGRSRETSMCLSVCVYNISADNRLGNKPKLRSIEKMRYQY